jgi:hypothetical protein
MINFIFNQIGGVDQPQLQIDEANINNIVIELRKIQELVPSASGHNLVRRVNTIKLYDTITSDRWLSSVTALSDYIHRKTPYVYIQDDEEMSTRVLIESLLPQILILYMFQCHELPKDPANKTILRTLLINIVNRQTDLRTFGLKYLRARSMYLEAIESIPLSSRWHLIRANKTVLVEPLNVDREVFQIKEFIDFYCHILRIGIYLSILLNTRLLGRPIDIEQLRQFFDETDDFTIVILHIFVNYCNDPSILDELYEGYKRSANSILELYYYRAEARDDPLTDLNRSRLNSTYNIDIISSNDLERPTSNRPIECPSVDADIPYLHHKFIQMGIIDDKQTVDP